MYLDCFKNNGKPYLRIVENYTEKANGVSKKKRKTIKNLGPLEKFDDGQPDVVKRMKEALVGGTLVIDGISAKDFRKRNKLLVVTEADNKIANIYLEPKNMGYLFLNTYFNSLGVSEILTRIKSDGKIEYDLNGIVKMLVLGRILDPKSKKGTFENKDKYLFPVTKCENIKEVYRALDVLDEKSETIQKRMNTRIKSSSIGRNTDITYYGVTNYYFETMYGDKDEYLLDENNEKIVVSKGKPLIKEQGFRKKGVSREYRPNPIVQMGLLMDNNGMPVSYKLFPGNTQDKTTFKDIIKTSINKADLGRIIVVADNGMNTQENKYLLLDKGNGYIVSKSIKKSWSKLKDWTIDEEGYTNIYNNREVTFKYKSRIVSQTFKDSSGNTLTRNEKEIIYWSKKHYDRELYQNGKFIEYLESCKANPDELKDKQGKTQEFIKILQVDKETGEVLKTKAVVTILDEKIQKYKETMGYYSIVSSEMDLDEQDIINRYHGLSRIEDSFRIIKSELEARPVCVWTKEHINAHFLICFIALTIIRLLQFKVLRHKGKNSLNVNGWEQGITAQKIRDCLNGFMADKINSIFYKTTKPDEFLLTISDSLGVNSDLKLPSFEELLALKNSLYTPL